MSQWDKDNNKSSGTALHKVTCDCLVGSEVRNKLPLNYCDIFQNWTKVIPPQSSRASIPMILHKNSIKIIGGGSDVGKTWKNLIHKLPFEKRTCHTAVIFKNNIVVMGGCDGQNIRFNDVWSSTDGKQWKMLTNNAS